MRLWCSVKKCSLNFVARQQEDVKMPVTVVTHMLALEWVAYRTANSFNAGILI
jgi:hypothetical protein